MSGRHGSMDISEFVDLVYQESYRPHFRFLRSRWGNYAGLGGNLCTLVIGNANDGICWNVPTPCIPEHTVSKPDGTVIARGWRTLLLFLVQDRIIRPSQTLLKLLGQKEFDRCRKGLGCS